jgi:hypothetical protein
MRTLLSDNGRFIVVQQDDGNFVVYEKPGDKVIWSMFGSFPETRNTITTPSNPDNPPSNPPNNPPPKPNNSLGKPILVVENVNPIGMSYWRNINNHIGKDYLYVVLSLDDELVLFTISKSNLAVIGRKSLYIHHTGEGCYFSAIDGNILFVPINNTLNRINVATGDRQVAWQSNHNLWQCHSSYDDKTHSASLKDADWKIRYWGVNKNGKEKKYDLHGNPDECQIDMSGKFLTAKETVDDDKLENRIITLTNGNEKRITNAQGSLGHSDCGFGCMIGENSKSQHPGALDYVNLETLERKLMFSTGIWNMGYVSFTNARDWQIDMQRCLISTPSELILVMLDGWKQSRVVCNNLTQSQEYEDRPKANLCPLGEFAIWTAKVGGKRNAYIVRL